MGGNDVPLAENPCQATHIVFVSKVLAIQGRVGHQELQLRHCALIGSSMIYLVTYLYSCS